MSLCPCGSTLNYVQCCKPYLQGKAAPTAEKLMRSRYTAYVKKDVDYLHRTWALSTRPSKSQLTNQLPVVWSELIVVETSAGQATDQVGEVAFEAWFTDDLGQHCMKECSEFIREKGRWVYLRAKNEH